MDPGVHVLQIDLTPTGTSTSPWPFHAFLISLILNDSKTDRHNNTTMTQHTSPVLYFHTDAILKKRSSCILFTENRHPQRCKHFLPAKSQTRSLKAPRLLASSLSLSSILLQQKLNWTSNVAEDHQHNWAPLYITPSSFSSKPRSFHPEASSPHRRVFSLTLPNRHFIIAAPTQITTSEPPSSLHSIAPILQISQQKHLTQTK